MARIRTDNVFGTTTNAPLLVGGTTLNSAGLANLAVVAGADRAAITLDPNRVNGAPEIVYVSAHTGAATSATILRGQEGTAAREHPLGTFWVHAPSARDHLGRRVLLRGEDNQIAVSATLTAISWEIEDEDPDGYITVPSTTLTVPAGLGGTFAISFSAEIVGNTAGTGRNFLEVIAGGVTWRNDWGHTAEDKGAVSVIVGLVAANTIVCNVFHTAGADRAYDARLELFRLGA